ncbi:cation transporter [Neisseria montereyensis]|uniref:Cation transporter n=1 Tax=Neisseria montereyensis TaxID=2973938 RepID=A0ABT2F989_9NEIS|nr:cation transporter [Neisseria montereyensis]MCS4532760.1 cation transporter [Neisseria montereyensis]
MACTHHCCLTETADNGRYRNILWIALFINALMFAVEIIMGIKAGSVSLLADSLDFFGDAANYGISLFVVAKTLHIRAKASWIKGYTMGGFGLWVLASTLYHFWYGNIPNHHDMGIVGIIALIANIIVAALLFTFRNGDSNRRSVWLCSRNDAIGNIMVVAAAFAVQLTQSSWPDLLVAITMAILALQAAVQIIRHANTELSALPKISLVAQHERHFDPD